MVILVVFRKSNHDVSFSYMRTLDGVPILKILSCSGIYDSQCVHVGKECVHATSQKYQTVCLRPSGYRPKWIQSCP